MNFKLAAAVLLTLGRYAGYRGEENEGYRYRNERAA
jgi:hypothetical protein